MNLFENLKRICGGPAAPRFDGADRRTSPRYDTIPNKGWMSWHTPERDEVQPIEILDVSTNGALVRTRLLPKSRQHVWVRLDDPTETEWHEAIVVRIPSDNEVALHFPNICPFDLYKAALGVRSEERRPTVEDPTFDARLWY